MSDESIREDIGSANRVVPNGHLVLMRRPGESIVIGNDVSVEVCSIEGSRVRLKIKAPRSITVARLEKVSSELGESRRT